MTIAVAGAFCASYCYDWAYLSSLGVSFREVPTTLADHTRSAFIWLPAMFVTVTAVSAVVAAMLEIDDEALRVGQSPYSKTGQLQLKLLIYTPAMILWISRTITVVGCLAFVLLGEWFTIGLVSFCLVIAWAIARIVLRLFGTDHPREVRLVVTVIPAIALSLIGFGWVDAFRASRFGETSVLLHTDQHTQNVVVFRTFDQGILYQRNGRIVFERWDSIRAVDLRQRPSLRQGILCQWLNRCVSDAKP